MNQFIIILAQINSMKSRPIESKDRSPTDFLGVIISEF